MPKTITLSDSNREDFGSKTDRIGPQILDFLVVMLDDTDALVTCRKCKDGAIVNYKAWVRAHEYKTRPCTYCFKASKIPMEVTRSEDL